MIREINFPNVFLPRLKNLKSAFSNMGITNTLLYIHKTKLLKHVYGATQGKGGTYRWGTLSTNQLRFPVVFRYNSSDINVFSQIFVTDEYRPLTALRSVKLIIDCGAYVGYSTAYFLSNFPEAHVFAVEPDKKNYEILKRNLSTYGDRATTINSAVWSRKVGLKVCRSEVCQNEWATTVTECGEGEQADLESVDIETLLRQSNCKQIDILKVDIEGAERVLFGQNVEGWINKVRAFAIELHSEDCREVFYRALSSDSFSFSLSGEITIAHRSLIQI
jgi:FkbM family methyltransferase